jgi:hypothetical protein
MARRPFSGGKGSRHSKAVSPANRNTEYATPGRHERAAARVLGKALTLSQRTHGQPDTNLRKIASVDRRGDRWNGRAIAACFWQP